MEDVFSEKFVRDSFQAYTQRYPTQKEVDKALLKYKDSQLRYIYDIINTGESRLLRIKGIPKQFSLPEFDEEKYKQIYDSVVFNGNTYSSILKEYINTVKIPLSISFIKLATNQMILLQEKHTNFLFQYYVYHPENKSLKRIVDLCKSDGKFDYSIYTDVDIKIENDNIYTILLDLLIKLNGKYSQINIISQGKHILSVTGNVKGKSINIITNELV